MESYPIIIYSSTTKDVPPTISSPNETSPSFFEVRFSLLIYAIFVAVIVGVVVFVVGTFYFSTEITRQHIMMSGLIALGCAILIVPFLYFSISRRTFFSTPDV
jgi:hypothetical protein